MSKNARRRIRRQNEYLIMISFESPDRFDLAWEKRISSWLVDIRRLALSWKDGRMDTGEALFDIVDRALLILERCAGPVRRRHWQQTCDVLSDACCRNIAAITDRRLYDSGWFHTQLERAKNVRKCSRPG